MIIRVKNIGMAKGKRGSHVEVVISFVIFMTFIFFIYLITQPTLKSEKKESSLENLANGLAEKASGNLTSVSASIIATQDCADLINFFSAAGIGNKIITKSDEGNVLSSGISSQDLLVQRSGNLFFRVYESEEFAEETGTMTGCQSLAQGSGYSLGLIKEGKSIFETKIVKLIGDYNSDYDILKNELKIPQGNDFDFSFTYNNGTEISTKNKGQTTASSINIYSRSIPVIYISKQAASESGLLNIKIW
jgi:hypothetical protein